MRRWLSLVCVLVSAPALAQQSVAGTERLGWTHDGVNVARFEATVDAAAPVTLTVTQAGTDYTAPLPAMTPGTHTIAVRACNVAGCGAPMTVTVRVVVIPSAITNLRIVPGAPE